MPLLVATIQRVLAAPLMDLSRSSAGGTASLNLDHLRRGALAGLAATGVMTTVIAAGRALHMLWTPPPAQITENIAERVGLDPEERALSFQLLWLAAHGSYGAVCGAAYVAARPRLPRSTLVAGLLYGSLVWGASYFGLMPALRLYPPPDEDSRSRLAVMVVAHAVFGLSLAETEHRLAHRREAQRIASRRYAGPR